jgi:hypothetical protein
MPTALARKLDMGLCCIGAPHFDMLMYLQLDVLSGNRALEFAQPPLTFHIGDGLKWAFYPLYAKHNLLECRKATDRLAARCPVAYRESQALVEQCHFDMPWWQWKLIMIALSVKAVLLRFSFSWHALNLVRRCLGLR